MSSSGYGIWWTLILHPFLARRQRYWESLLTLIIFKSLRVTEHKQKLTSSQLSHLKKKGPLGSIYQFGINTGLWVTGDRGWCQHHTASRWKPISDAWKLMHLNFAPVTFQGAPGLWVISIYEHPVKLEGCVKLPGACEKHRERFYSVRKHRTQCLMNLIITIINIMITPCWKAFIQLMTTSNSSRVF